MSFEYEGEYWFDPTPGIERLRPRWVWPCADTGNPDNEYILGHMHKATSGPGDGKLVPRYQGSDILGPPVAGEDCPSGNWTGYNKKVGDKLRPYLYFPDADSLSDLRGDCDCGVFPCNYCEGGTPENITVTLSGLNPCDCYYASFWNRYVKGNGSVAASVEGVAFLLPPHPIFPVCAWQGIFVSPGDYGTWTLSGPSDSNCDSVVETITPNNLLINVARRADDELVVSALVRTAVPLTRGAKIFTGFGDVQENCVGGVVDNALTCQFESPYAVVCTDGTATVEEGDQT